jgi:hypothetical protein
MPKKGTISRSNRGAPSAGDLMEGGAAGLVPILPRGRATHHMMGIPLLTKLLFVLPLSSPSRLRSPPLLNLTLATHLMG